MNGPTFLGFYGILSVASLINAYFQRKKIDYFNPSQNLKIPSNPDPYEITYLRGGKYELIRLIIFELYSDGYLAKTGDDKYTLTSDANLSNLEEIKKIVANMFHKPKTIEEIFKDKIGISIFEKYLKVYDTTLLSQELILNENQLNKISKVKRLSLLFILGLGFYRLWTSFIHHHYNVFFLIIMMIVFSITINLVCKKGYVSKKGKEYLQKIKLAFYNLKDLPKKSSKNNLEPNMSLALGVYGFPILAGTAFANDFETMFKKKPDAVSDTSSSSSSCGSSCGSSGGSSCSGSSCGGGGCGGGGCS